MLFIKKIISVSVVFALVTIIAGCGNPKAPIARSEPVKPRYPIKSATLLEKISPKFPASAQEKNIEGEVDIQFPDYPSDSATLAILCCRKVIDLIGDVP